MSKVSTIKITNVSPISNQNQREKMFLKMNKMRVKKSVKNHPKVRQLKRRAKKKIKPTNLK